jgi:hypothetical protein
MNQILNNKKFLIALILSIITLIRIFIGNASFPFFNNVDEHAHFDLIVKYSDGIKLTKEATFFNQESSNYIILYGSPEYIRSDYHYKSGEIPKPNWSLDLKSRNIELEKRRHEWTNMKNHEIFSPPLYYAVLGGWMNLGKAFGIQGGYLLYWLRIINICIYLMIFWISYLYLGKTFQNNNNQMHLGVLTLIAVFPQDVFYGLNNDSLSSLLCLISFLCLMEIILSRKSCKFHFFTGIIIASAFLVKIANFPLLFIFGIIVLLQIAKRDLKGFYKILILVITCSIPIFFWFYWNFTNLGDITGTSDKIQQLGWKKKPFVYILDHPIFTMEGVGYFLPDLVKTFWRGELVWGLQVLASENSDLFYFISSCFFIFLSMINTVLFKSDYSKKHRITNIISLIYVFSSVLFIMVLSMMYDFGEGHYPSKQSPFFTSGRLLLGAMIPFLILYIDGIRIMIRKIYKPASLFFVLLIIAIFISHYEIGSMLQVIKSKYNFFHL